MAGETTRASGDMGDMESRPEFDTNMDVLPARRQKGPNEAKEEEPEKQMSKRKKRKLEQLAQKKASKELRSEVLEQLKSVQLTPEQVELMRSSQSTRLSKREQQAMAQRRAELGIPLTQDMKRKLRRRPKAKKERSDGESAEGEPDHEDSSSDVAGSSAKASSATVKKAAAASPAPAPAKSVGASSGGASVDGAAEPGGSSDGRSAGSKEPKLPSPAEPKAKVKAKTKAKAKAVTQKAAPVQPAAHAPAAQPLQPVRVARTEQIEEQRSKLPAVMVEQELVEMALSNDVLLVCGDTGCGKSTQVPQFLYECGICNGSDYLIAVTQPRRVAAVSVAQRVGQELNDAEKVGYQVRYDKSHCSKDMRIKFMTDGILLREVQSDFMCRKYTAIVIDEAHERGVNCDILIGLLSRAVQQRRKAYDEAVAAGRFKAAASGGSDELQLPAPPLKLVIMSATLRLCDFTENQQLFPTPPPVMRIDARTFPVTVHFERRTEEDYIKAAHRSVLKIHRQLPPGTILVFVTGRHEVHRLCRLLRQSQALASLRGKALEDADAEAVAEEEQGAGHQLLEASDDEANASEEGPAAEEDAAAAADAGAETRAPKKAAGPKAKRKRKRSVQSTAAPADASEAVGEKNQKKPKSAAAEVQEAAVEVDDEMPDVSFSLGEEDVVVLEGEAASVAEDAKDREARNQKKIRMSRLDKSRSAGGVFKGAGFGEGPLRVLPLYAQLSAKSQLAPFAAPPEGERVVVVSTNVAETSVTLPNVRYVIDCGHEKRRRFKASSGVSSFVVERISKASADQRAGRAGRLGPGHSYRLYSAAAYENHFAQFAPIPMLHTPMDPVLLLLAFLGVPRLDVFPWPTPPSSESVAAAVRRLRAIGAIEDDGKGQAAQLSSARAAAVTVRCTKLGFRLASLPVAPRYARMLLAAVQASSEMEAGHIIGHACAVVAALSVGNLTSWESVPDFEGEGASAGPENELVRSQREARQRLDQAMRKEAPKWSQLKDDAEGTLWLMGGYAWAARGGEDAADDFCRQNKINSRQMAEAHSLMQQLAELLQRRLSLESAGLKMELPLLLRPPTPLQAKLLRESIVEGLLDRVAVACSELGSHAYVCADLGRERPVFIHNSSNVYRHRPSPSVIVFNEIISTHKHFMRDCVGIDPLVLAKRAASGGCPLLQLGEFLPVPAPRYLPDQDTVLAFASPSYTPLGHSLPTVEVDVPEDVIFRYKVLAKALLEGEVIAGMPPPGAHLLARPALVLQAPTNPRVAGIVTPLWQHRVSSRAQLVERWKKDNRFLLEGYLKWLPASLHEDVRLSWPPKGLKPGKKR
eukprot:TRINITY_DN12523_c0_g2_i3.p1 TRINITY_DN12523_c0_g2~~TRINITY_DN12523_c0_g2_i3.p1  ORF type:complete len:1318 (+),score=361.79 TRINITY_DN12523_c0_g2_i3:45-3998(+)